MIYVYALTDSPSPASPETRGIDESPIELLGGPRVFAACRRMEQASFPPTPENLLRHEAIVEALMTDRAVLPARFGTLTRDDAELRSLLHRAEPEFVAGLERVRGMVEIGVRVRLRNQDGGETDDDPACRTPGEDGRMGSPEPPRSGRDYMRTLQSIERRRREGGELLKEVAAELHGRLSTASREQTSPVLATPALVSSAAYLVPRDDVAPFRRRVERFADAEARVEVLCTGPWPAYHFVPDVRPKEECHG